MSLWRRIFAERRSVLVPLVALIVIDGVLLAGVVLPLRKVVAAAHDEAEGTRNTMALANQRLKQMQAASGSRTRAETELAAFYGKILPASQVAARRVMQLDIAQTAREDGLRMESRDFEDTAIKDTPLQKLTTKVELVGDYAAILRFLYDVETAETFLVIDSISLSPVARVQTNGQLQLSLEMSTYYRTPQ